jgi:hypothetical protein
MFVDPEDVIHHFQPTLHYRIVVSILEVVN